MWPTICLPAVPPPHPPPPPRCSSPTTTSPSRSSSCRPAICRSTSGGQAGGLLARSHQLRDNLSFMHVPLHAMPCLTTTHCVARSIGLPAYLEACLVISLHTGLNDFLNNLAVYLLACLPSGLPASLPAAFVGFRTPKTLSFAPRPSSFLPWSMREERCSCSSCSTCRH